MHVREQGKLKTPIFRCSFADGLSISDVDWDTEDGHACCYTANGSMCPNSVVLTEPNHYGPAVVWPYMNTDGNIYIRCFLPGSAHKRAC